MCETLIIGGTSGIGLSLAKLLCDQAQAVIITGRSNEKLAAARKILGDRVQTFVVDIGSKQSVAELRDQITPQNSKISKLVISSGAQTKNRTILSIDEEDWSILFSTNVLGVKNMLCIFHSMLKEEKDAHVICVTSVAGTQESKGAGTVYGSTKYALEGLIKNVRNETDWDGIRFSVVSPGGTNTPFVDVRGEKVAEAIRKKLLSPEDVAKGIYFILNLPPGVYVESIVIRPV